MLSGSLKKGHDSRKRTNGQKLRDGRTASGRREVGFVGFVRIAGRKRRGKIVRFRQFDHADSDVELIEKLAKRTVMISVRRE